MKHYAEHGRIGVCRSMRRDELYIKSFSGGYPYMRNDIIVRSSKDEPVYSYAKNYTKDSKDFALFVWSTEPDQKLVESQLDEAFDAVSADDIDRILRGEQFVYV